MRRAWLLMAVLACCSGKSSRPPPLAELLEGEGTIEAEHGAAAWTAAAPHETFAPGDKVRTGPASSARLRVTGAGVVRLGPDTTIRFVAGGEVPHLGLEAGEAQPEAAVVFETEAGPAKVEAGSAVSVTRTGKKTAFEVRVGRATIQLAAGPITIATGEGVVLEVGGAAVERYKVGVGRAVIEKDSTPPPPGKPDVAAVVTGDGVRARVRGDKAWRDLPAGPVRVEEGATLVVAKKSSVELERAGARATVEGPAEVVVGAAGQPLLSARRGKTRLTAAAEELAVAVPGGTIVVRRDSVADLELSHSHADVTVERGSVEVRTRESAEVLRAGETATVEQKGDLTVGDRIPDKPDFGIQAGESPIIHDPGDAAAVRLEFGSRCAGDGIVELADASGSFRHPLRSPGTGSALVYAPRGKRRYRIRCLVDGEPEDKAGLTGSITVTHDAGATPVAKSAPVDELEADGRKYTVLYQNRLPELRLRWPAAPSAGPYRLRLVGARGKDKSIAADAPNYTFTSGAVAEGSYTWWFEAGGKSSPHTTLRIDFDNAAPAAQITAPRDGDVWSGESIEVAGTAQDGWKVSVAGQDLSLDGSGRFNARVARPDGDQALVVRLEHPAHGVHYYVRRPAP